MEEFKEEWRPAVGYEGLYEVSNTGKVARVKGYHCRKRHLMRTFINNSGYVCTRLCKNNHGKTELVHRMIALAFIPNPNNYPQINHKDCCKTNNNVSDLEWCTGKYNSNYADHKQKQSESHINNLEKNKLAKKVICIETGVVYNSTREIERKLGHSHTFIALCCRTKRIGFGLHWEYLKKEDVK